jgi:hypothetical protein
MLNVNIKNIIPDFETRKLSEGIPLGSNVINKSFNNANIALNEILQQVTLQAGRMAYLEGMTFTNSSDTPVNIQTLISTNAIMSATGGSLGYPTSSSGFDSRVQVSRGSSVFIPVNGWLQENTLISTTFREAYSAFTGGVSVVLSGTSFTNDPNWSADKIMVVDGDSISVGSLGSFGTYTSYDMFFWKMRNYFKSKGYNIRLVNKGAGGRNSLDSVRWMRNMDWYSTIEPISLYCYQMGMNDPASLTISQSEANLREKIAWKQSIHPKAKMIVFGTTQSQINNTESSLVSLRSMYRSVVNEINDPNISFLDLSHNYLTNPDYSDLNQFAFNRLDNQNYTSTDTAGAATHPNVLGNQRIFDNAIVPKLDQLNLEL